MGQPSRLPLKICIAESKEKATAENEIAVAIFDAFLML